MEIILTIIHDEGNLTSALFNCEQVINSIAARVQRGQPEPDVNNLEIIITGPPPSGNNSTGSSPSASPTQQVIRTSHRQGVIGTDLLSPARWRPTLIPDSDDSLL